IRITKGRGFLDKNVGTVVSHKKAITDVCNNSSRSRYVPYLEVWPTQPHHRYSSPQGDESPPTYPATSHPLI
ncbi:hypothetical protein AVEN_244140-1, partial [Araneus ventricosus]